MAESSGWLLYIVMAVLMLYMWRQVRGLTFDAILITDHNFHIQVHHVIADHPQGGNWSEYQAWMNEDRPPGGHGT